MSVGYQEKNFKESFRLSCLESSQEVLRPSREYFWFCSHFCPGMFVTWDYVEVDRSRKHPRLEAQRCIVCWSLPQKGEISVIFNIDRWVSDGLLKYSQAPLLHGDWKHHRKYHTVCLERKKHTNYSEEPISMLSKFTAIITNEMVLYNLKS